MSIRRVIVKQTKELEKTYFVLLEKLKEPKFARIAFGIPGIFLILFFFFQQLGIRIFVGLLGLYLLLKGFGIEDFILRKFSKLELSAERVSSIFSLVLSIIAVYIAFSSAFALQQEGVKNFAKIAAVFLKTLVAPLAISVLLAIIGNLLETVQERKTYQLPSYGISISYTIIFSFVIFNIAEWVLGNASFRGLFFFILLSLTVIYLIVQLAKEIRKNLISKMNLAGKAVYTESGGYFGKVVGFNRENESFILQTRNNQKIDFDFSKLANIGDKLIVRF